MKPLTLDRLLQSQGYGTRKWCQQIIADGEFSVDGAVVTDHRQSVIPDAHHYTVLGKPMIWRAQVYIALHKPPGYECSRKASHYPGVHTLLPEEMTWREVQPVGRLDHDTTGLLLLSDDGGFIHRQASPKHHVPKVYRATTAQAVDPALLIALLSGVKLHDEPGSLAALSCTQVDSHTLDLVLAEGKYHQVKRMLAAAGNHCAALSRIQIGGLTLASLQLAPGEWCYLETEQLALLVPDPAFHS